MKKSNASTTSPLNEGQSHIPKGNNGSKHQMIEEKCWIVQQLALILPFQAIPC
jgi:hypothetical protein